MYMLLLQEMSVLYVIALIGFIARKRNILPVETDYVLTQLVLFITLPALILFSMDFSYQPSHLYAFSWLIGLSGFALTTACIIGYLFRRWATLPRDQERIYEGLIVFGNQGFIGYAVIYILLGEIGILYTAVFNFLYIILIWTYGIFIVAHKNATIGWQRIFINPGVIATILGFFVCITPLRWPQVFYTLLKTVGLITIPLSMLVIGTLLATLKPQTLARFLQRPYLWLIVLSRLFLIPLCLTLFGLLIDIPSTMLLVAVLVTGTPSAPTIALYAKKYGGDAVFASVGASVTTIVSIASIPFLYMVLQWL